MITTWKLIQISPDQTLFYQRFGFTNQLNFRKVENIGPSRGRGFTEELTARPHPRKLLLRSYFLPLRSFCIGRGDFGCVSHVGDRVLHAEALG